VINHPMSGSLHRVTTGYRRADHLSGPESHSIPEASWPHASELAHERYNSSQSVLNRKTAMTVKLRLDRGISLNRRLSCGAVTLAEHTPAQDSGKSLTRRKSGFRVTSTRVIRAASTEGNCA